MGKKGNGDCALNVCERLRNNNQSLPPKMINYKVCRQLKGYCGPACLKIVFDYYGIVKSQEEWAKLSGATHEEGVQNDGLFRAIKTVGFSYKVFKEASFDDIRELVKQNKTVIAIWWSGEEGHYSPIADISDKTITLADPTLGRFRRMGLKKFDHLWFDFAKDNYREARDLQLRNLIIIYKTKQQKAQKICSRS